MQGNQRSNCQHQQDHRKTKEIIKKKNLLLLHCLCFKKESSPTLQFKSIMHLYGIWKDGNDDPICQTAKETQMYRTVFWTLWEKARVGWFERIALKHVFYHMWNISGPGSMHETGCSGLVHWDDPEGWDGEGGGKGVQDGEHMYTHGWFMSMYGKNHYNTVK